MYLFYLQGSRDDFDPKSRLQQLEHGHRILNLDSNEQLPKGWADLTLDDGGLDNDMANLHHSPLHLNDSIGSQTGNHQSIDTSISSSISSILDASDSNDSTLALPPRVK